MMCWIRCEIREEGHVQGHIAVVALAPAPVILNNDHWYWRSQHFTFPGVPRQG